MAFAAASSHKSVSFFGEHFAPWATFYAQNRIRARAENTIPSCKVGFMERPERIVLVIIGALANRMAPVLWILAVLSTITVIHRIRFTYVQSTAQEAAERQAASAS